MRFACAEAIREMDRYTIDELGIPGETLMLQAASGVADAIKAMRQPQDGRVLILCGSGNNGGDGIGVAALLLEAGYSVDCYMVGNPEKLSADSLCMRKRLERAGGSLLPYENPDIISHSPALIVDALFGTGLSRPISGKYQELIQVVNAAPAPVVSCDIPSGIHADTGEILSCAVKADLTVTFHMPKVGLLLPPGTEHTGQLIVHDIGIPPEATEHAGTIGTYVTGDLVYRWLPKARRESHKGDYGKLLLLCGSTGFTGAAALSSGAALRTGAGLVYLGTPESVYPILATKLDEPVVFPLPCNRQGRFARSAHTSVISRLQAMDACLIGPGIGNDSDTQELVYAVLEHSTCPVVLDADGISAVANRLYKVRNASCPVIMTPHDGEFRRIGGDTESNRITGTLAMAEKTGAVMIRKGYRTVIASPDGQVYINSTGNPGMAVGGSGDVLSGILTCLLGQGMEPVQAAAAAVWIHGAAGDLCQKRLGVRSMLPSDMIEALHEILRQEMPG